MEATPHERERRNAEHLRPALELPALASGVRPPAEPPRGQPAGLEGCRFHRHRGRRSERAQRLPRRPAGGVLLAVPGQRAPADPGPWALRARGAEGGRHLPDAAARAALAAAARARQPLPGDRAPAPAGTARRLPMALRRLRASGLAPGGSARRHRGRPSGGLPALLRQPGRRAHLRALRHGASGAGPRGLARAAGRTGPLGGDPRQGGRT